MYLWSFGLVLHTICINGVFTTWINIEQSSTGIVWYNEEDKSLSFECLLTYRLSVACSPIEMEISAREISLYRCEAKESYFAELQELNIDASTVESLYISFDRESPLPPGNYTRGLVLVKALNITNWQNYDGLLQYAQNFLEPLVNLKHLSASMLKLPPLPESASVVDLMLSQATIEDWGNCQYLEHFEIEYYYIGEFPEWPENCSKLKSLAINNIKLHNTDIIIKNMMPTAHSLTSLKINNCLLMDFPLEILTSAENLTELDLSDNNVADNTFPEYFVMPRLRKIRMGNTYYTLTLCDSLDFVPLKSWPNIEFIEIINIDFNLLCFSDFHYKCLRKIEMSDEKYNYMYNQYNYIYNDDGNYNMSSNYTNFNLMHLPKTDAGTLEVGLKVMSLINFLFNETDYRTIKGETLTSSWNKYNKLIVYTEHLIYCDCENGWLARALRDFPDIISMPKLLCYHGENQNVHILDEPPELLECDRTEDDDCNYRKRWDDGTLTAVCLRKVWYKDELPNNLYGLNVSGQGINTLRTKLPDSLQWLDISYNAISSGNAEEAAALFAAGRHVWLANNPLLCDCDNRALLDAIQQSRDQVIDYDLLKCTGTDKAISEISTAALCKNVFKATTISLVVCGVVAVIAGLTALLLRRYGEQLSMFLYSRGWFVSCLQKLDSDDKPYDAFLSFAHEDQEYVTETLLPGLENAPEQFRICVHYRDWPIGDWIPVQIMRSVQLSKRTLIVLSRNFVASAWSTLELRYSLANITEDPNAKVLVLIKDDVLDMDLDKDLRRYLTFNTYLRCDDPWFWEKLRYAMPHKAKKIQCDDAGAKADTVEMRVPGVALGVSNSSENVQDIDDANL